MAKLPKAKNPILRMAVAEVQPYQHKDPNTEEYYKWQCDILANSMLVNDNNYEPEILKAATTLNNSVAVKYKDFFSLEWPNKGEVVAGSFALYLHNHSFEPQDIDIYFKSKELALEFAQLNNLRPSKTSDNQMCLYYSGNMGNTINLIFGVDYLDVKDLISKFDIRVCSMAITNIKRDWLGSIEVEITNIAGSFFDASKKELVFNPNPRGVSIARLIKYVNKGFSVPTYQRLFFSELIRSEKYNVEVEKFTKY